MKRTKEQADESKRAILDAAYSVFLEKGYTATKVEDIAHKIGMTRGVIYWHFKNKTDLFFSLINKEFDNAISKSQDVFNSDDSLENKLVKLLNNDEIGSRFFELIKTFQPGSIDRDSKPYRLAIKQITDKFQSAFDQFGFFVTKEQKCGNVKKSVDVQAFCATFVMISGILNSPRLCDDTTKIAGIREKKRNEIVNFIWNGLGTAFLRK
ncbi:MAG: TetR family transcriptional regulator [Fibrobacteres bacterium]|nr:TetR family transcriptional regulator [Fibrobacterota bacterium]